MKKKITVFVCLAALFLNGFLLYLVELEEENKISRELNYLLSTRANILNKALYGTEDFDHIADLLEEIEKGKILEEDIEGIKLARKESTDYPIISDFLIKQMEILSKTDNSYEIESSIEWYINDFIHEYTEKAEYYIKMIKQNGNFFLISLEPIN